MGRRSSREITEAELEELLASSALAQRVPVEVLGPEVEPLTEAEERLRRELEGRVEQAFFAAGAALRQLRDGRLYRSTHSTFEAYCRERFGHSRQKANFLIAAARIYENLTTSGCQLLPANERQLRPLNLLDPASQAQAWTLAVSEAGGRAPSGRLVRKAVESLRERVPSANPYRPGDACQVRVRDDPELSGKDRCWALVRQVHQRSCTVACWDGESEIQVSHLDPLPYSPAQCRQLAWLEGRLRKFQEEGVAVEAAAYSLLEHLGKLDHPELTALEEKLLILLEQEYLGGAD